jgi:hypothetical protein
MHQAGLGIYGSSDKLQEWNLSLVSRWWRGSVSARTVPMHSRHELCFTTLAAVHGLHRNNGYSAIVVGSNGPEDNKQVSTLSRTGCKRYNGRSSHNRGPS